MKMLMLLNFIFMTYALAQKTANCADYDNNRIRCLAKKRCLWKDAGGSTSNGFCTYKPTEENKAEIEEHDAIQKIKIKCLDESQNLQELDNGLTRATIYQDSAAIENLKDKIIEKIKEIQKIPSCDYKSLIKLESSTEALIKSQVPQAGPVNNTQIQKKGQTVEPEEDDTEAEAPEDSEE